LSYDDKMTQRKDVIAAGQQRFGSDYLPLMHAQEGYSSYTSFPFNNAYLLVYARYNQGQDDFAAVHKLTGGNWAQTLQIFREAAKSEDPLGYLHSFAGQQ
jgi:predicted aminopeptidase